MKGAIEVPVGRFYCNKISQPIREKKDCILLLLDTLEILVAAMPLNGDEKAKIVIRNSKMSRAFYFMQDKYYSILFPFSLEEREENDSYAIYDPVLDMEVNNREISLMRTILDRIDFINSTVETMLESIYYDMEGEEYAGIEIERCWGILMRMFSLELGYIRYDYDPEHVNGDFHPPHHLDINYSAKCTYKLGLKEKISINDFTDLLDIQTKCKYLV